MLEKLKLIKATVQYLGDFIKLAEYLFGPKTGSEKLVFVGNMLRHAAAEEDILGPVIDAKVAQMKASGELTEAKPNAV